MKKVGLFILAFLLYCLSYAQTTQPSCLTDQLHDVLLKSDAAYKLRYEGYDKAIHDTTMSPKAAQKSTVHTLPIVIHIITPIGTSIGQGNNLTDVQVLEGLNLLNQSFANAGVFAATDGVDMEISFCLARRDPQGQPTNGITRYESNLVSDITTCGTFGTNAASDAAIKQLVNWDCTQYINIWLVTDLYDSNLGCSLAGYAYFPGAPCTVDGIVQESRYWNTVSGTQVTAHEMGHYLNLNHTFLGGCTNTDCLTDGDRVCDTPPDSSPGFASCTTNSCSTDIPNLQDDNSNYMDYTSCTSLHFSQGQKLRAKNGLLIGRTSLVSSLGCQPVAQWDASIQVQIDTMCSSKLCPIITLRNNGLNTISSIDFSYNVDGGANQTYSWSGNLPSNNSTTFQIPCVNTAPGSHTFKVQASGPNGSTDSYPTDNLVTMFDLNTTLTHADFEIFTSSGFTKILKNLSSGAISYLWDFGDGTTAIEKDPSHTYIASGNYTIKLIATDNCGGMDMKSIVISVTTCTPGWRGYVGGLNNYQEPDELLCDMVSNGQLQIESSLSNIPYYWTSFSFCDTICVGKNFTVQVRLKNDQTSGGISAYDTSVEIKGTDQSMGATLMGAAWGQSYDRIWAGSTVLTNLPQLVLDLNTFKTIELKLRNDTLYYQYEGANFFKMPFDGIICNITNINITFKGSGTVDWLRVLDQNENLVFSEDFSDCNNLNQALPCQFTPLTTNLIQAFDCQLGAVTVNSFGGFGPIQHNIYPNPNNSGLYDSVFINLPGGFYRLYSRSECPFSEAEQSFEIPNALQDSLLFQESVRCNSLGRIGILAKGGMPPFQYKINNGPWKNSGTFENLMAGTYQITIRDNNNCELQRNINILDLSGQIALAQDSVDLVIDCIDTSAYIAIHAVGGIPYYHYSLDGGLSQTYGIFRDLSLGAHSISVQDEYGCQGQPFSFTVTNNSLNYTVFDTVQLCNGGAYQVGTSIYTLPGNYINSFTLQNGCDSVVYTLLEVLPNVSTLLDIDICTGESYTVGTHTYQTAGLYQDTLVTSVGCDSIVVTDLSVLLNFVINQDVEICQGDSVKIGMQTYYTQGMYSDSLLSTLGCDSIIITNLTVNPTSIATNTLTICAGESYSVGTNIYNISGVFKDTLVSINGCDSILVTDLTVLPNSTNIINLSLCEGDSVVINQQVYNSQGLFSDTLLTIAGCDSILQITVAVMPKIERVQDVKICTGESLLVGAHMYSAAGSYLDTLLTSNGCDSIINTHLEVLQASDSSIFATICENERYQLNSFNYSNTGIYTDTILNMVGCDSLITLNLTVLDASETVQEFAICRGDSVLINDVYQKEGGRYIDTILNALGCDSIVLSILRFHQINHCDSLHCRVYAPNAFSPHGQDVNSRFKIYSPVVQVSELAIYDRWGDMVFRTQSNPIEWDGKSMRNQMDLAPGVYIYTIRGTCSDGSEYFKAGDVLLVR
jgi:gliding motility-associated-like protein